MLKNLKITPKHAIMLGDSDSDYQAAKDNNVLFFLRSTEINRDLQNKCKDKTFKDFINSVEIFFVLIKKLWQTIGFKKR